jgi:MFS family permease
VPPAVSETTATSRPVAPWYGAYLILGLLTSGLLPFLLPLLIASTTHQLGTVAYVSGAYNLGLLPAPLLGRLAERHRLYRPLFFGAFVILGVAFAVFPRVAGVGPWFLLALLIGIATGGAATVATLFVVDFAPRSEWESRIGWLQSFNGAGQLGGLILAGAFAQGHFELGFSTGAVLAVAAIAVGGIGLPVRHEHKVRLAPIRHFPFRPLLRSLEIGPALGGLVRHSHHLQWAALRGARQALGGAFGRVLLAWFAYNFGVAAFFAYYPLMMRRSFGIPPEVTALAYAVAAGIGVFLFVASSQFAVRYGARAVFRSGIGMRLGGFVLLGVPFVLPLPATNFVALIGFLLITLAWPVISVSGTALAARLTPISEGAAIGLLSASGALATVAGTFCGGPLVHAFGFGVVPVLALAGLIGAELTMTDRNDRSG